MDMWAVLAERRSRAHARRVRQKGTVALASATDRDEIFNAMRLLQEALGAVPYRSAAWFGTMLDLAWGAHLLAADTYAQRLLMQVLAGWSERPPLMAERYPGIMLQLAQAFYYTRRYDLTIGVALHLAATPASSPGQRVHARALQIAALVRQRDVQAAAALLLDGAGMPQPLAALVLSLVRLGQGYTQEALVVAEQALRATPAAAPVWQWRVLAELHGVAAEVCAERGDLQAAWTHFRALRWHNGGRPLGFDRVQVLTWPGLGLAPTGQAEGRGEAHGALRGAGRGTGAAASEPADQGQPPGVRAEWAAFPPAGAGRPLPK